MPRSGDVMVHLPVAWSQVGWALVVLGVLVSVAWLADHARAVSLPLLAAFGLAYVLNPLVDRMVRCGLPRAWAIVLLLLGFAGGATLMGLLLGPRVVQEAREVPGKLRQVLAVLRPQAQALFNVQIPDSFDSILAAVQAELGVKGQPPFAQLAQRAGEALSLVFGGTLSALASLGAVAITPLFSFYMLRDFHRIMATLAGLWPQRNHGAMRRVAHEIDAMLGNFVRGQLMVGGVLTLLYVAGFYLVKSPLALLLGILTGLGNMVPFVGTAVGLSLATLFNLLGWHGWVSLLAVWGVFVVNHLLEAWLITPRIVGTSVGLSPLWVIVAVLGFGELLGFVGVLLGVPLAAVLKILAREALWHYQASTFYRGTPAVESAYPGAEAPSLRP